MRRLWSSEWLRVRSRRSVWLALSLGAVAILVGVGIGTARSTPPESLGARPTNPEYRRSLEACLRGEFVPPDQVPPPYESLEAFCRDSVRPESFEARSPQLRLADLRPQLEGMATIFVMLGVVLGATLGGADWSAGSITTLLTWEPRRVRVLLVRAIAAALAIAVITLVLQGWLIALYRAGITLRGSAEGTPADWLGQVAGVALRTSVVAALLGIVALAAATLGRSTGPAVGALLAYLVGVEGFLAQLIPRIEPWLLVRNAVAAITRTPIVTHSGDLGVGVSVAQVVRTPDEAWLVLAAWAAVSGGLAIAAFRTRDVH